MVRARNESPREGAIMPELLDVLGNVSVILLNPVLILIYARFDRRLVRIETHIFGPAGMGPQ